MIAAKWWDRFRVWVIGVLGGYAAPVEKRVFVKYETTDYKGLGRPLELSDWERLAIMNIWAEPFFRFIAYELQAIDGEERRLGLNPEKDRERLALSVRRGCLIDIQKIPERFAAKVAQAYNKAQESLLEKGRNNNGK